MCQCKVRLESIDSQLIRISNSWLHWILTQRDSYLQWVNYIYNDCVILTISELYLQLVSYTYNEWIIFTMNESYLQCVNYIYNEWIIFTMNELYLQWMNYIYNKWVILTISKFYLQWIRNTYNVVVVTVSEYNNYNEWFTLTTEWIRGILNALYLHWWVILTNESYLDWVSQLLWVSHDYKAHLRVLELQADDTGVGGQCHQTGVRFDWVDGA